MKNSNTLSKIEVGDTVIFRTDLRTGKRYGTAFFLANMRLKRGVVLSVADDGLFHISHENNYWYSPEMVAQVIKPTKERVYTEQEMIEFADKYAEYSYRASMHNRFKSPMSAKEYLQEYIESLNK